MTETKSGKNKLKESIFVLEGSDWNNDQNHDDNEKSASESLRVKFRSFQQKQDCVLQNRL